MTNGLMGMVGCSGAGPKSHGAPERVLAVCPASPNCVSSQAADQKHRVAPLSFRTDPDQAFGRLKMVLQGRDDTRIMESKPGYVRVEFRTILFVDDGEFLLDREHSVIHIRSASRLGYYDFGKNRNRLEDVRRQFLAAEMKS